MVQDGSSRSKWDAASEHSRALLESRQDATVDSRRYTVRVALGEKQGDINAAGELKLLIGFSGFVVRGT